MTYRKYPPDPPSRRSGWLIIAFLAVVAVGSLVSHWSGA